MYTSKKYPVLNLIFYKRKRETNSLCEELKNLSLLAMTASTDFFFFLQVH